MKRFTLIVISIFIMFSFIGCGTEEATPEIPNTMPPSIMVDGELYFSTGEERPIEPDESEIKTVTSVVKGTELPSNEGEINVPAPNAKYAKINDYEGEYVVVSLPSEWVRYDKRDYWGLELTATNISPTGLTLSFSQYGGNPKGDLQTGSYYWLDKHVEDEWVPVEILSSAQDVGWTDEAYIINMNDITEWEVGWEWLYGELSIGNYRIGKEIMDYRSTGGILDTLNYYADFKIVE
ncbi:immunoglobulin-like domain-containing protein [Gudongella sp. SC589]|jgi:hypothetical protein|uniref:immunoglobulin-like domain-containing protein n=1 Tax=Gudongella sp. SC589 TaxID=3385990 RepID=UPI003904699B